MATYCNAFKMETDENKFGFAQNPDSFESWQGRRGPYYTPSVSADGTLSWVNNGGLPNPQPVNIAGPPGQGLEIQGVVETVQQLPTGAAQGDVWLVGTDSPYEAYIWVSGGWLDLGQVAVGPQGPAGEPGTDGVSPEVTVTEISGGNRVTITDAGGAQTFDVMDGEDGTPGATGPQGPAGETGPAGPTGPAGQDGAAATIAVGTVSGLPAGSTPTVTNSGSSSAAIFNFGIPAGADGATGPTGPAGPGVPSGGSAGQILAKIDGTDYNTQWINPNYKFYNSVTQLGLISGSATIAQAYAAMPNYSVLMTNAAQFASGQPPVAFGLSFFVKGGGPTQGWLIWRGKEKGNKDWRMFLTSQGVPTGTWEEIGGGGAALYFTAVACAVTTGDFATVSDAAISADTVVAEAVFANPSAITSDVTWTTSAGQLVLNGTCATATTVNLVLVDKIN